MWFSVVLSYNCCDYYSSAMLLVFRLHFELCHCTNYSWYLMLLEVGAESIMEGSSWLADAILFSAVSSPTPFGLRVIVILIPSPTGKDEITELLEILFMYRRPIQLSQKVSEMNLMRPFPFLMLRNIILLNFNCYYTVFFCKIFFVSL